MLGPLVYLKGCMIFWEGRRDYPHEAIQEAVSSAIIHSDYSILRDEMISMWRFLMTYWKLRRSSAVYFFDRIYRITFSFLVTFSCYSFIIMEWAK